MLRVHLVDGGPDGGKGVLVVRVDLPIAVPGVEVLKAPHDCQQVLWLASAGNNINRAGQVAFIAPNPNHQLELVGIVFVGLFHARTSHVTAPW